jgi:hypothetical protein
MNVAEPPVLEPVMPVLNKIDEEHCGVLANQSS